MSPPPVVRRRQWLAGGVAALLVPWHAQAQEFPSRPIRIVSPSAPGGLTDIIARLLAERMSPAMKVPVVVENRPGGTGAVALEVVAKAPPDGHTLVVGFSGANITHPLINDKLPFNARRDFTPISLTSAGGGYLMVHPSVPANNLREFAAHVKAQGKPASYGTLGNGSTGHLAGEFLRLNQGIDLSHVPYRSATALTVDMVGGHMPLGFLDSTNAVAQRKAGKLRMVAQTGPTRSVGVPDVPTLVEQGVNFSLVAWTGVLGPARMPPAVVARLNAEINRILTSPDVQERWLAMFGNPPAPTSAEEFDRQIQSDFALYQRVINEAKITL